MTTETRDWEQLRSDAIRAAREAIGDDELAERATDAVLSVVDEETVRALCDDHIARTNLRSMDFRNGANLEIQPAREMVAYWVGAARTLLDGAENYSETTVEFSIPEDPQRYAFTVQKVGRFTPHQKRQQAEDERDKALAELERLRSGTVTEWGVRFDGPPGFHSELSAYDTEDEARHQAAVTPTTVGGWSATLMWHQVGPWTEVPETEPREDGDHGER